MRKLSVILLFLLPLLFSCVREEAVREGAAGEPVQLTLRFGGAATELTVGTKSTHTLANESRVYNLYLFIFDSESRKIYGKYFDYSNLSTTGSSTLVDWWEVTDSGSTAGTVHIRTLSGSGCRVVAIANIDAEMVNISPEQLGIVSSYADLYAQKASLNQLIVSRSGYFPMSGELSGVQVAEGALEGTLMLARLDARIRFKVRVEDGSQIAGFTPLKWQVVNLPRRAWVLGRDSDAAAAAVDFFSTGGTLFETEALTDDYYSGSTQNHILEHGFSFYMLENRKAPVQDPEGVWEYAHREQQEKLNPVDASVAAQVTNGDFLYADPLATYVVITARVTMDNVTYGGSEGATLSGDVRYIVHLGDFSDGKYNDFNVQRNHGYTYSVYVRDVNDIRVEVENNYEEGSSHHFDEPEPGATGSVAVALEEVYTSDAHYSSHVMSFHERHIDPDKVTWEVQTPFNPSGGRPVLLSDGTENTVGLDFEWVEFRLNDKDADGVYFDSRRQLYKPMEGTYADGKTMNVSGLVAYLKDQKRKFDAGLPNDFDNTADEDGGPKISVTAFVNEYYYETNPLTGEYQKMLWKKFVNQPMRYMYILSETRSST